MIDKTYAITLNLTEPMYEDGFDVVLGDTQTRFEFTLKNLGGVVDITDLNPTVVFSSAKGTTAIDSDSGVTVDNARLGQFSAVVPIDAFCSGNVLCEVSLFDADGRVATTSRFSFRCITPLLSEQTIASLPSVGILQGLIGRINAALDLINETARYDVDIEEQLSDGDYEYTTEYFDIITDTCKLRVYDGEFYYYIDTYRAGSEINQQLWNTEEGIMMQYLRRGSVVNDAVVWTEWYCFEANSSTYVRTVGGTLTGALRLRTPQLYFPYADYEAVSKSYVDAAIAAHARGE